MRSIYEFCDFVWTCGGGQAKSLFIVSHKCHNYCLYFEIIKMLFVYF